MLCHNRKKAASSAITVPVNFLSATWQRYTASVRGQSESAPKNMAGYARERAVRKKVRRYAKAVRKNQKCVPEDAAPNLEASKKATKPQSQKRNRFVANAQTRLLIPSVQTTELL
ncbi:hypothetical protein BOM25_16635 [Serratia sp. OPWLW2]|nr:hypothetical protein BOM25_16635 [Serratia sp. OPWLW2]